MVPSLILSFSLILTHSLSFSCLPPLHDSVLCFLSFSSAAHIRTQARASAHKYARGTAHCSPVIATATSKHMGIVPASCIDQCLHQAFPQAQAPYNTPIKLGMPAFFLSFFLAFVSGHTHLDSRALSKEMLLSHAKTANGPIEFKQALVGEADDPNRTWRPVSMTFTDANKRRESPRPMQIMQASHDRELRQRESIRATNEAPDHRTHLRQRVAGTQTHTHTTEKNPPETMVPNRRASSSTKEKIYFEKEKKKRVERATYPPTNFFSNINIILELEFKSSYS